MIKESVSCATLRCSYESDNLTKLLSVLVTLYAVAAVALGSCAGIEGVSVRSTSSDSELTGVNHSMSVAWCNAVFDSVFVLCFMSPLTNSVSQTETLTSTDVVTDH